MSLQKGNLQAVSFSIEGKDQQFFIQANPQYKTLIIYDQNATRPLNNEQKLELMTPEARRKLNRKDVSIKVDEQGKGLKKDDKGQQQAEPGNDDSLLPKKRAGEKKGISIS